jgi:hypothetical protein
MNELYLGLGGAGVVVIAAVVAYNAWQGAKVRRKLPRAMPTDDLDTPVARMPHVTAGNTDDDRPFIETAAAPVAAYRNTPAGQPGSSNPDAAAPTGARREPTFSTSAAPGAASPAFDESTRPSELGEKHDDATGSVAEPAEMDEAVLAAAAAPVTAVTPAVIDRRIDCVVPIRIGSPVSYEKLATLVQRLRRAGSKPVFIEGRLEGSADQASSWESLQAGGRYEEVRASVQLANRSGALNELEFSEFVTGVQFLADAIDGAPDFPDMLDTVQMARELDGFAAQCDAQLSVNVRSDGAPWSANYVQSVAAQDGLLLSRDGTRFVKLDAKQNPVFMLQFEDTNFLRDDLTYKGGEIITLLLDVPVADEDILPFRLMCDYAASLSQRIGAHVVDDQRRPLPESALLAIEKQLLTLYARLEQAGIPAGSAVARRLFSN